jgi:hypothetical protein
MRDTEGLQRLYELEVSTRPTSDLLLGASLSEKYRLSHSSIFVSPILYGCMFEQ